MERNRERQAGGRGVSIREQFMAVSYMRANQVFKPHFLHQRREHAGITTCNLRAPDLKAPQARECSALQSADVGTH